MPPKRVLKRHGRSAHGWCDLPVAAVGGSAHVTRLSVRVPRQVPGEHKGSSLASCRTHHRDRDKWGWTRAGPFAAGI
eukprot:5233036-Amphidinium_carterae.1